jgi:hypothetical protein
MSHKKLSFFQLVFTSGHPSNLTMSHLSLERTDRLILPLMMSRQTVTSSISSVSSERYWIRLQRKLSDVITRSAVIVWYENKIKFPLILQCCSEKFKDSLQSQIKYLYFMKFCLHPWILLPNLKTFSFYSQGVKLLENYYHNFFITFFI